MAKAKIKSRTALLKEYNKYVTSINKQLKELEEAIPDSVAISRYKGEYRKIGKVGNISRKDMIKLHSSARELAESGRLDISNQERALLETINTFNSWGYKSVNRSNINEVLTYLESLRQKGLVSVGGSGQKFKELKRLYKNNKITDDNLKEMLSRWI